MKEIIIGEKKYNIDCNAMTYVKYKSFFKTGIMKDMQFVHEYLIKQVVVAKELEKEKMDEAEKLKKVSEYMIDDTDEFIIKITQIAWILIYTADKTIANYDEWLNSIDKINTTDGWIVEVTEYAVDCFC